MLVVISIYFTMKFQIAINEYERLQSLRKWKTCGEQHVFLEIKN